jgi:hypothetical protein
VTFICVPGKRETVERIGTFCFVIKNVRKLNGNPRFREKFYLDISELSVYIFSQKSIHYYFALSASSFESLCTTFISGVFE